MHAESALEQAIRLLLLPSSIRMHQAEPLPRDVNFLYQVLARESEAEKLAVARSNKSIERIRQAAEFYVCQVVFCPSATPYRILGVERGESRQAMRQNMALLLRWLHPDHDFGVENRQELFDRVVRAWEAARAQPHLRGQSLVRPRPRGTSPPPRGSSKVVRAPRGFATSARRLGVPRRARWLWTRPALGLTLIALGIFAIIEADQIEFLRPLLDLDWRALSPP